MCKPKSLVEKIDDIVGGLISIQNMNVVERGSREHWSLTVGISLLNDCKNTINELKRFI